MRLDKFLANSGVGSRKEVKTLLKKGSVQVNGKVVKSPSIHVDEVSDVVTLFGDVIEYKEFIYIMMNKPDGVISATEDKYDETVIDLLDEWMQFFEPFPVGRLDKDTEGLLLITNDGKLAHELLAPKKHVPKTYFVQIAHDMTEEMVKAVQKGIELDDGYVTLPGELVFAEGFTDAGLITIHEGKFHQIKRMFEALGSKVIYLQRVQMGPLKLDESLELGEFRELTAEELDALVNVHA